jgi:O-antigen/teichoic acid export membrane protein
MTSKFAGLVKSSLIYSLGGFGGTFVGILLVPVYTRMFSPEEYGVVDLIGTTVLFLNLFLVSGLDSAVGRYYVDTNEDRDRRLTSSTALIYLMVFSIAIVFFLAYKASDCSSLLFGNLEYSNLVTVAMVGIPFLLIFSFCLGLLKFRFQPITYVVTTVGCFMFQISLTIYLVVITKAGLLGIYVANLITFVVFSMIGLWLTRRSYAPIFSLKRLKELLHFGVPLVPLSLAHYVMTYSDRYFLKYFADLHEVGLFGIGYRLASVMSLVVFGFQNAWGPFVYSTYKDRDAKQVFSRTYDYLSIVVCVVILLLSLFAEEILLTFTTEQYKEAYKVVPLIGGSIVAYTFGAYFAVGIGIAKKNIHMTWAGSAAAMINLGLNYALIPPLGMVGAALATIISFILLGAILMTVSQRYYSIPYRLKSNIAMYVIVSSIILFAYAFIPCDFSFRSVSLKLSCFSGFLTVPFLLKLVGLREVHLLRDTLVSLRNRYVK